MTDRKRVSLMVAPETKEEWQSAVEESTEYSSLSGLIRRSVTNELSPSGEVSSAAASLSEATDGSLEELADTLNRVESKVEDIDSRVSSIEGSAAKSDSALTKNKIFTALNRSDEAKSAERLADEIGFPEEKVAEQLESLEANTGLLESVESDADGSTRYYTETN